MEEIGTFEVIGITTRTTNENGQSMADIEALWGRFWGDKIQDQIPNKLSDDIYAVYTNYESDYMGSYSLTIGARVRSLKEIPDGFTGLTVEGGAFRKYVSKGKMPDAVVKTWMEIWSDSDLKRAYTFDFTVHGEKYFDGDKAEVETFISIVE